MLELAGDKVKFQIGMVFTWGNRQQWFKVTSVGYDDIVAYHCSYDKEIISLYNGQLFKFSYFYGHIVAIKNNKQTNYKRGKYAIRFGNGAS